MTGNILPHNPIPPELQEPAKALFSAVEGFEWSNLSDEERRVTCELDRALIAFFNLNEHDPLDDGPDVVVSLNEAGELTITETPEKLSREVTDADRDFLAGLRIAPFELPE